MRILVIMPTGHIRDTFIPPDVAAKIECLGTVEWNTTPEQFSPEVLKEKLRYADICIAGWDCPRFDEDIVSSAVNLKLLVYTGGSVADFVSDSLYKKNIKILSGNQVMAESVAEGTMAYILNSLRDIPYWANEMQAGRWKTRTLYIEGLLDRSVGLVGFGAVARYLVKFLEPFRAKIRVYDPYITGNMCREYGVERCSLEDVISKSKIISLHAPNIPETHHMINRTILELIPDGAIFINTARGGIVDEEALAEELAKKRFKAVLDVYEIEPLPENSRLRGLENVILMPHLAGLTSDRRKVVTLELLEEIKRFLDGRELKHEINKEYAMRMTRDD